MLRVFRSLERINMHEKKCTAKHKVHEKKCALLVFNRESSIFVAKNDCCTLSNTHRYECFARRNETPVEQP